MGIVSRNSLLWEFVHVFLVLLGLALVGFVGDVEMPELFDKAMSKCHGECTTNLGLFLVDVQIVDYFFFLSYSKRWSNFHWLLDVFFIVRLFVGFCLSGGSATVSVAFVCGLGASLSHLSLWQQQGERRWSLCMFCIIILLLLILIIHLCVSVLLALKQQKPKTKSSIDSLILEIIIQSSENEWVAPSPPSFQERSTNAREVRNHHHHY